MHNSAIVSILLIKYLFLFPLQVNLTLMFYFIFILGFIQYSGESCLITPLAIITRSYY